MYNPVSTAVSTDGNTITSVFSRTEGDSIYTKTMVLNTITPSVNWTYNVSNSLSVLGLISELPDTATEADFKPSNYLALDGADGTKKLPANAVAKAENVLFDYHGAFTDHKYIDADGVVQDSPTYPVGWFTITDYIPVNAGKTYPYQHLNSVGTIAYSCFYDSTKNVVSTFKQKQGEIQFLEIPQGVSFVRFSLLHKTGSATDLPINFIFFGGESLKVTDLTLKNGLDNKADRTNVLFDSNGVVTKNKYIDVNGVEQNNPTTSIGYFCITDYIPVDGGKDYYYSYGNIPGGGAYSAFYDSSKQWISPFKQQTGELTKLSIPQGVSFVRFSVLFNNVSINFKMYGNESLELSNKRISALEDSSSFWGNHILCVNGDSVEAENDSAGSTPYGHFSKMLVDALPWSSSKIIAVGGTSFTEGVDTAEKISSQARVNKIPSNTTIVITGGATNDWGKNSPIGSLSTINDPTTFYGALHVYFQRLNARLPNAIKVMVSNQLGVCPNRWSGSHDPASGLWSNTDHCLLEYHKATKEVCDFDGVFYIPMYEECGINIFNYTTYNVMDTISDGHQVWVHPSVDGAKKMLSVVLHHLDEIRKKVTA